MTHFAHDLFGGAIPPDCTYRWVTNDQISVWHICGLFAGHENGHVDRFGHREDE